MPLYWLVYRHNNSISVVIEPGASLIHARLELALRETDCLTANFRARLLSPHNRLGANGRT
jgi:hypothetical protein